MTKRAAIIVTDADRIYVAEAFIGAYRPTSEVVTDPQLLADLRRVCDLAQVAARDSVFFSEGATDMEAVARVRAALGDDDG